MKKAAVLTTHRANNYGAALQSYALTHVARRLGADCEVLDYRTPAFEKTYHSFFPWSYPLRAWPALLHHRYLRDVKTIQAFARFRRERMVLSRKHYTNTRQLESAESQYDLFIVGSDQVWNPRMTAKTLEQFDRTYLLDFVKNPAKKASYAASMGISELPEELADIYRQYLADYAVLTVREHRAAELLQDVLKRDVTPVCDPVLLLTGEEWQKVEQPVALKHERYILVYNVCDSGQGMNLEAYARQLAKEKQCAVYFIQPPISAKACNNKEEQLLGIGPAEFVWLIRNARELVTTSFHGSAIGLTYGKRIHIKMEAHSVKTQRNSRILSLMRYFGLEEDQILHGDNPDYPTAILMPDGRNLLHIEKVRCFSTERLREMLQ